MVRQRFPVDTPVEPEALVGSVTDAATRGRLGFGDPRVVAFLDRTGRLLLDGPGRRYPELAALGFFLRAARLRRALAAGARDGVRRRSPVGLVFHVPPGNVATMFAYGWAVSALAGNPNIVRLPARGSEVVEPILDALRDALAGADPVVADTQRLIAFDRDDDAVRALSAGCRLRVLWGGDAAIDDLRRAPLPAAARDLPFADRTSLVVLRASAWLGAPPATRDRVTAALHTDTSWYDLAACSSPRIVVLVGAPGDCTRAGDELFRALAGHPARQQSTVDGSVAMYQRTAVYRLAADGYVDRVHTAGPGLTVARLARPYRLPGGWWGPDTFATAHLDRLTALVDLLDRRHQTVTHFGFGDDEIEEFAMDAARRGVDRIVPVGEALTFDRVWDGYDLLDQFSRTVTVRVPEPAR